ncbi:MAG: PIN domain-containing protein [Thermoanaerobaculia bacterium]|nr:PIN domain-containing protein [Thermoanaerobaculia bacterium]
MRFVDTNVLLFALGNERDEAKAAVARAILDDQDLGLSVQVLQEFYVQATRESRDDALTHVQASRLVESFLRFPIQELTVEVVRAALATRDRYQLSYWDAAILEAARALGCDIVLSEDLNSGQDYGGVRVENPFVSV